MNIYLDDVRTPKEEGWIVVRDYYQFVNKIQEIGLENINLISLDHDLGDKAMREYFNNVSKNYKLDYDKKLIDIYWIVNNSNDNSLQLLHDFKNKYNKEYNSINIEIYNNSDIPAETRSTQIREKYIYIWL